MGFFGDPQSLMRIFKPSEFSYIWDYSWRLGIFPNLGIFIPGNGIFFKSGDFYPRGLGIFFQILGLLSRGSGIFIPEIWDFRNLGIFIPGDWGFLSQGVGIFVHGNCGFFGDFLSPRFFGDRDFFSLDEISHQKATSGHR